MSTTTKTGTRMPAENTHFINSRTEEMTDTSWDYRNLLTPILLRMQQAELQRQRELEMIDSTELR